MVPMTHGKKSIDNIKNREVKINGPNSTLSMSRRVTNPFFSCPPKPLTSANMILFLGFLHGLFLLTPMDNHFGTDTMNLETS